MKTLTLFLLLLAGCVVSVPDTAPTPKDEQTIWTALAARWEAGKIADTDELIRICKQLEADGDIEKASKLDALDVAKANRKNEGEVRAKIAEGLRGIK